MLWSNPTPSSATAAALTAGAHLSAPDIGPLIAAILKNRQEQQKQEQQGIESAGKGITSAISGIQGGQDASNLAQYQNLSTNGQTNGSVDQANSLLQSMSPQAQIKAQAWTQHQQELADKSTDSTRLLDAKIHELNAHGDYWSNRSTSALAPAQQAVQDRFQERTALADLNQKIKDLNNAGGLTKPQGPRITRDVLGSTTDVHSGVGPQGEYLPEGYYGIGNKSIDTIVPAGQFDTAHKALDTYSQLQQRLLSGGSQGGGDVNAQIMQIQNAYRAGKMSRDDAEAALNALGIQGQQ